MESELFSFKKTFERLKSATGADTDSALANKLGVGQGSISSAKSKGQIPPSWLLRAANDYAVSLDWLYYGEGPKTRRQQDLEQPAPPSPQGSHCPNCLTLESELRKERELTRDLVVENRQLWRENRDLSVALARARAAPAESEEESRRSA